MKNKKKNLIFQQDSTLYHVSKVAEEVFKNTSKLKFWSPNSPDLSPIENVWDLIQERI